MTNVNFLKSPRAVLVSIALALAVPLVTPLAHAQSAAGTQGDAKKPMPPMGKDMNPGMNQGMNPGMNQGMNPGMGKGMHQGMDMKSMMTDMNSKMTAMQPSGNVDVDFAMMMRVHHQGAITMAEGVLQNGKDPQMRIMAKEIIRAQKKEIDVFDKFLAKRGTR